MPSWIELSRQNHLAARDLRAQKHWRSSVSRSYYAVFAALVAEIRKYYAGYFGKSGWENPAHSDLGIQLQKHLGKRYPSHVLDDLRDSQVLLRLFRTDADYRPQSSIDESIAGDCFFEANRILGILKVL